MIVPNVETFFLVRFPLAAFINFVYFDDHQYKHGGPNPTKQYVRDDLNAKLFNTDGSLHMLSLKNKSTNDKTTAFKELRIGSSRV